MASEHARGEILDIIERQAQRSGIPREDFLRFAYIETGGNFDPDAHNTRSGAKGLFQFLPDTAAEFRIAGREFDPAANTEAAAALYRRNMNQIVGRQAETGHAFLSGAASPNGLDMYLAHQQGGGGYASIQSAIDTGGFSRSDTRGNILGNIGRSDFERVTQQPYSALVGMNDHDLATSFTQYWSAKYAAIEIEDRGIQASGPALPGRERAAPLADGVLESGERGQEVRALQQSLNELGFRDQRGAELETTSGIYGTRTAEAVRGFQAANSLEATGVADQATRDAISRQLALPGQERNRPQAAAQQEGVWPTPGNHQLNRQDIPGEGNPNFGWTRRNADGSARFHAGIDIEGNRGDPVVAYAGGTVVVKPNNGAAGNTVHIRHDDGVLTKYFHLDAINVANGARVEAGQQIGTIGDSGNARGLTPHLHFEMHRGGQRVDPMQYLPRDGREPARDAGLRTPDAAGGTPLRNGATGQDVRELQQQLNQLGYTGKDGKSLETSSGIFGAHTQHALRAFQAERAIGVDGIHGNESREALAAALREREHAPQSAASDPLRQGSRSAEVAQLQNALNALGYADGRGRALDQDGVFGDRTREAVERFQQASGLDVDGIAGTRTQSALEESLRQSQAERTEAASRGGEQGDFIQRMLAAAKSGDERVMQAVVDDYLQTPAGQDWRRQAESPAEHAEQQRHDPDGLSR